MYELILSDNLTIHIYSNRMKHTWHILLGNANRHYSLGIFDFGNHYYRDDLTDNFLKKRIAKNW